MKSANEGTLQASEVQLHVNGHPRTGTTDRPFIFVNMAITADGKIATANRNVSSFGSAKDREHLLELRSQADAVMAGARTVDSNEVNMGPGPAKFRQGRLRRGLSEYNIRIIVSRSASINPDAHVFKKRFSPILILTTESAPAKRLRKLRELADEVRICGENNIEWNETLVWLKQQWKVSRLLCEGGGALNDDLFRHKLVDELNLTICPYVFGGFKAPTIADGQGVDTLAEAARFHLVSTRRKGSELFLVYAQVIPHTGEPKRHKQGGPN